MSTYAPTNSFQQRAISRKAILPSITASALSFWIPLAVVALSLYGVEHSLTYATSGYKAGDESLDLAKDVGNSSLLRQVSIAAIGLIGGILLLRHSELPTTFNRWQSLLIVSLCAWLVLSALWADEPLQSLKRSIMPVLMILGALGIAKHLQPRQICLFVAILTAGYLLLGFAGEIINGSFLEGGDYRFSGTLHPNNQGVYCAALCLASLTLFHDSRSSASGWQRSFWLMLFIMGAVFLLLTRSRTSAVALAAALLVYFALGASRSKKISAAAILVPIGLLSVVFLTYSERGSAQLLNVVQMGRSQDANDVESLTGRVPIWTQALGDVAERPLVGYGYGGFWTAQRVMSYTRILNWEFNHAHSSYLETLLNAGAIGLALGLLIVVLALWSAAASYRATNDSAYLFIVAVLVMAMVHGVLDSNFVTVGFAPLLAMFCISAVVLHRDHATREPSSTSTGENGSAKRDRPPALERFGRMEPA
jgi:exopolysaccharide production protein ExoQ